MAGSIRPFVAVAVASLVLVAGPRAAVADAAAPACAERVLDDWSDGRIDATYERRCYLDAIAMLPEDVRAYTSAADDLSRALQAAGGSRMPDAPDPPRTLAAPDAPVAAESSRGLPASVVLLLAIAVAVLAAGSAGLVARRLRGRRSS